MELSQDRYREIAGQIASEESPVGIDAEKTHVLILHMLEEILDRLDRIEVRLNS